MQERVRELRRRLAPVLEVVSAQARRDIEELFDLASQPTNENARLLREVRDALDLVERATGVTAEPPPRKRSRQSVHALLVAVLGERQAPLSARDLTAELVGRGATVTIEDVRRALERDEFVQVGRHRYELAQDAEPLPKPARALAASHAPAQPAPAPAAIEHEVEPTEPILTDRLRVLFEHEPAPLTPAEIAQRLLASGWSTRSSRPQNVISAALSKSSEFVRANGKYRLAGGEPASAPEEQPPRGRAPRPDVPLGEHVHSIVTRRGSAMTYDQILEELACEGWTSASTRKRDLIANAVRLHPELELVLPGVVWIRDAGRDAEEHAAERPVAGAARASTPRPAEPLADPQELAQELAFVRQHIADARDDTAVLAPAYATRQLSAWAARARSIAERAAGRGELADECRTILRELGTLAKLWWLGRRPPALTTWASPREALTAHSNEQSTADPSWEFVADRLDAQLEAAYDDSAFDDGWADTRWLADDERFAPAQLDRADALLARIGAPTGAPLGSTAAVAIGPKETRELIEAARGLRWVRGVVLDGTRWGLCMGRLRWLAQKHPAAIESKLAEVLAPDHQPVTWGFDEDAAEEKRQWLTEELATMNGAALEDWLVRAVECFEDADIARLIHGRELSQIDLRRFESRRVRNRIAKLLETMGVAPSGNGAPLPELGDEPPRGPSFPSVRALIAETFPRRRALMLSNRLDSTLEQVRSSTFDLDLEWCVASPGCADAASDIIRSCNHDLVLSATGFQTPSMDAGFTRAARAAAVPFTRVNRGRTASCARALHRPLSQSEARRNEGFARVSDRVVL